ncbi:hypothetical protein GHNINEIG_00521 [Hydrogenovibrio crunogenus]|uniref:Uncharacterized protein n=1 Tax=Hydrogenovibrio crunogenus TaxID=39765 RepID=A0A4P7NXJ9_9GAMM|nr:hypothetical protein [Hydrogenovibrio crunogenus]QBZ82491.1 hypothetical protein GHNINEIG_00521 [Hydrogenovibrio crunogenus]
MANSVEPTFMNGLSFTLRPVATELFNMHLLKELLEIRQGKVPSSLVQKYTMSQEQWVEVSNVVILTKLSQFTISKELKLDYVEHLQDVLRAVLDMEGATFEEVHQAIQYYQANVLADWYRRLQKHHTYQLR